MELNHQEGLQTLPSSFRVPRHLSQQLIARVEEMRAAILRVPFHKLPPPKESMKKLLENRGLKRAYWLRRVPLWILSNRRGTCSN
jgi:hypothetical protein